MSRSSRQIESLRKRAFVVLRDGGFTHREIGDLLGITHTRHLAAGRSEQADTEDRDGKMLAAFRLGATLEQIASEHRVTRERVRQILKRLGARRNESGIALASKKRAENAAQRRDADALQRWGCTHAQYQELQSLQRESSTRETGPLGAFQRQRSNANLRGIPFKLNLWQWWGIWLESGHWDERGRGSDSYCMARIGDCGAYEVGNVKIIRSGANTAEGYVHKPFHSRHARRVDELGLTKFQRRVYDEAIQGRTTGEIAALLNLKRTSVSNALASLRQRRPELRSAA